MSWRERKPFVVFGLRFLALFAGSLMSWPYLADGYVAAMAKVTNPVLSALAVVSRANVRLEPPAEIRADGSWKGNLRVEDQQTGEALTFRLDTRSFSYRPVVTFAALAAASSLGSARRRAVVWGGGLLAMFVVTTCFSALPLLSRFAATGIVGGIPGLLFRTAYQATATPVMVYAIPVFVWWIVTRLTRPTAFTAVAAPPRPVESAEAT